MWSKNNVISILMIIIDVTCQLVFGNPAIITNDVLIIQAHIIGLRLIMCLKLEFGFHSENHYIFLDLKSC